MRLRGSSPKFRHIVSSIIFNPGFKAVVIVRLQIKAQAKGRLRLAQLISNYNLRVTGAEFCVGVKIGPSLIVRHPNGIVVGGGVKIGQNLTLLHGVTIGLKDINNAESQRFPNLGNNVTLGTASTIIGDIYVADGTIVGAHTLVNSSTEANGIYVGTPSKRIDWKKDE